MTNMDFNIITFHNALNHGAVLQTYALQTFIEELGFSASIYDYRRPTANKYAGLKGKFFKLLRDLDKADYFKKESNFDDFLNTYLHLSKEEECKVFLSGSDQVWNTGSSMDSMYFLQFVPEGVIRASYAASMGSTEISEDKKDRIRKYLDSIDFISVREGGVKEAISKITSNDIYVNIDPTFLLDVERWRKLELPVQDTPEKYILVYIMHFSRNVNKLLKWLKSETGAEIVVIDSQGTVQGKLTNLVVNDKSFHHIGPREFLWLVDHAQSVVTSSFHGTAFSIIFKKEFYSIVNPAAPSRLMNLLRLLELRGVSEDATSFVRNNEIDWDGVRKEIKHEREKAEEYLRRVYSFAGKKVKRNTPKKGNVDIVAEHCVGCSVCASVCPTNAISMELSKEGFLYPKINGGKCVNCSKCINTCPAVNFEGLTRKSAFYGWHKDDNILFNSSSGGAFHALAKSVIDKGGVDYSAVYSDDFRSVFFSDSDRTDIIELQKSKYTVSNPTGIYEKMKQQLQFERKVLFCGTPCQVAGLMRYLGEKEYENLITVDFVCGGMASLRFYREHIQKLEEKKQSRITKIDFRPKDVGWGKHHLLVTFKNGDRIFTREYNDAYFKCFAIEHISVRRSCLECDWHALHRSDITLADFWGYNAAKVEVNPLGTSLIVANSEKGTEAITSMKEFHLQRLEMPLADYAFGCLNPSKEKLRQQTIFFKNACDTGFEKTAIEMYGVGAINQVKKKVNSKLKRR